MYYKMKKIVCAVCFLGEFVEVVDVQHDLCMGGKVAKEEDTDDSFLQF